MSPVVLVLPLCLVPVFWAEFGTLIQTADYNNPLNPSRAISQIVGGWAPDNLGQASFREAPLLFPYLAFWWMGGYLGLPLDVIQRLWLFSLFGLTVWSAWSLVRVLVPPERRRAAPVCVALAAYVFNPFTLTYWAIGHQVAYLAYAAAPLWLSTFITTMKRRPTWVSGVPLALVSLLFAAAANNPPVIVIMIILPTTLVSGLLVITRQLRPSDLLKRSLVVVPWLAVVHAWWLIPTIQGLIAEHGYSYAGSSWGLFDYPSFAYSIKFQEFLRGTGYWGLHAGYQGVPYFRWSNYLEHPIVVAATIWLALCVVASLVRWRPTAWALVAGALFAIGVFFSKGINPPMGELNEALYRYVPGFFAFRETEKFTSLQFLGVLIALASLLGGGVIRERALNAGVVITGAAIIIATWPMFDGSIIQGRNENGVAQEIRIPPYYSSFLRWTQAHDVNGSILTVPQTPTGYIKTSWGFAGADLLHHYSVAPVVLGAPEARPGDGPRFAAFLEASRRFDKPRFLRRLGISHVVVRHDLDASYYPGTADAQSVERRLVAAGFRRSAVVGALHIYETPGAPLPVRGAAFILVPDSRDSNTKARLLFDTELPIGEEQLKLPGTRRACVVEAAAVRVSGKDGWPECEFPYQYADAQYLSRRFNLSARRTEAGVDIELIPVGGRERSTIAFDEGVGERLHVAVEERVKVLGIDGRLLAVGGRSEVSTETVSVSPDSVLSVFSRSTRNLLGYSSSKNDLWGGAAPIGPGRRGEWGARAVREEGRRGSSLELISRGRTSFVARWVSSFDATSPYELALDYRHIRGGPPAVGVWQSSAERYATQTRLAADGAWHHHERVFLPDIAATSLGVYLYSPTAGQGVTVNRYDNVAVRRLRRVYELSLGRHLRAYLQSPGVSESRKRDSTSRRLASRSLLADGSFERSLWNGAFRVGPETPSVLRATHSADATHGTRSLELVAHGGAAATSRVVEPFDPDALYRVTFSYKHITGRAPAFGIWEDGVDRYAQKDFSLSTTSGWHLYETVISPSPESVGLRLFLYSLAKHGQRTVNRYDNVRVVAIPLSARLLFVEGPRPNARKPVVELEKQSSSRFEGVIRGLDHGGWIILAQDFNPSWRLEIHPENGSEGYVADHVLVDGFANGWRLVGSGDFRFELKFERSRQIPIGFGLSGVGLLIGVSAAIARKRRERGNLRP